MSGDANQFLKDYRNFILTVEKPEGEALRGSLFHKTCAGGARFGTFMEMARLVEDICDQESVPKAVVEDRCFVKTAVPGPESQNPIQKARRYHTDGTCDTVQFRICLRHRYNASWQGWIERKGTNNQIVFHSFLELIEQIVMAFPEEEVVSGTFGYMLEKVNGCGVSTVDAAGMQWYTVPGATYHIQVLYQENDTWQGIVKWLEAKETMRFRSFLELAKLTDMSCAVELEYEELQLG